MLVTAVRNLAWMASANGVDKFARVSAHVCFDTTHDIYVYGTGGKHHAEHNSLNNVKCAQHTAKKDESLKTNKERKKGDSPASTALSTSTWHRCHMTGLSWIAHRWHSTGRNAQC